MENKTMNKRVYGILGISSIGILEMSKWKLSSPLFFLGLTPYWLSLNLT